MWGIVVKRTTLWRYYKRGLNPKTTFAKMKKKRKGVTLNFPSFSSSSENVASLGWLVPPFTRVFLHHRRLLCFRQPWPWNSYAQLGFESAVVVISPSINTASICFWRCISRTHLLHLLHPPLWNLSSSYYLFSFFSFSLII